MGNPISQIYPKFRNRGVSLLEIVVALTILTLLTLLTLPFFTSLSSIRESIQCSSNLREIGTGIILYCNDHDGLFPGPTNAAQNSTYTANQLRNPRSLIHFVHKYLNLADPPLSGAIAAELFQCPASRRIREGNNPNQTYYLHRGTYLATSEIPRPLGFYPSTPTGTRIPPIKAQVLSSPSRTVLLLDGGGTAGTPEVHDSFRNILFADGRVEKMKLNRFQVDAVDITLR